jgi:S1-C subfamily serine protease
VIGVEPDGPAAAAGVRPEDLIVAIGGQPVASMDDMLRLLPGEAVGAPVEVRVVRAGRPMRLELVPVELVA